ncbi:MAG: nucleotide exchange factor GrpE [Halanaerobiales bacterium]
MTEQEKDSRSKFREEELEEAEIESGKQENGAEEKPAHNEKSSPGNEDSNRNTEDLQKAKQGDKQKCEEEKEVSDRQQNEDENEELSPEEKVEQLQEELEKVEEEKNEYYKQLIRLKSDFTNYRRRVEKEKKGLELEARVGLINEILPVLDNFERALESSGEEGDFKEGIEMIYKQLLNVLKQEGLEVISAEGESFDHRYHEAIMRVEDQEVDSGTIIEEVQKGYLLEDKVVRPSMVKVAE